MGKLTYIEGGDELENQQKSVLAFHETMDTHEMLNFKTVCLLKSKMMQGICFDNDLKALMQKDVQQSMKAIKDIKEHYAGARTDIQ
jgi:similar to spore coat protein